MRILFVEYNQEIPSLGCNLFFVDVTHYEEKNTHHTSPFSKVLAYWDLQGQEHQIYIDYIVSYWEEKL